MQIWSNITSCVSIRRKKHKLFMNESFYFFPFVHVVLLLQKHVLMVCFILTAHYHKLSRTLSLYCRLWHWEQFMCLTLYEAEDILCATYNKHFGRKNWRKDSKWKQFDHVIHHSKVEITGSQPSFTWNTVMLTRERSGCG